jgi:hypothetical protein
MPAPIAREFLFGDNLAAIVHGNQMELVLPGQ